MDQETICDELQDRFSKKLKQIENSHECEWGVVIGKLQLWHLNRGWTLDAMDRPWPNKYGAYGRLNSLWLFYDNDREIVDIEIKPALEIKQLIDEAKFKPCHR